MVTSLRLPLAMNEEIEVLVESGEYPSRSDVLKEAFRVFFRK
jgi:Arc/MetJ-type ribon-helix-helix transcriptional regulator